MESPGLEASDLGLTQNLKEKLMVSTQETTTLISEDSKAAPATYWSRKDA